MLLLSLPLLILLFFEVTFTGSQSFLLATQVSLMVLLSTPSGALGIEPHLATYKLSTLLTVLFLWPHY